MTRKKIVAYLREQAAAGDMDSAALDSYLDLMCYGTDETFTDDEARLALCIAAEVIEAGDAPICKEA